MAQPNVLGWKNTVGMRNGFMEHKIQAEDVY